MIAKVLLVSLLLTINMVNASHETGDQHWIFEYVDDFMQGLNADEYVPGSQACALNFRRAEENLHYMN